MGFCFCPSRKLLYITAAIWFLADLGKDIKSWISFIRILDIGCLCFKFILPDHYQEGIGKLRIQIIIQNGIMTRLESMIARTMNNPSVVIDNISNVTIIPSEDKYFFLLRCKVYLFFGCTSYCINSVRIQFFYKNRHRFVGHAVNAVQNRFCTRL